MLVLVAAGSDQGGICEVVDILSNRKCKTLSNLPHKYYIGAGDIVDGSPLICGGYDRDSKATSHGCYAHDRSTDKWNHVANMKTARVLHTAVSLGDTLWVVGGQNTEYTVDLSSTEYVYMDGRVTQGPNLPYTAKEHCMTKLHDGRVMILGGYFSKKVVIFDPKTNTFTNGPTLLYERYESSCTLFYSPMHGNRPVVLAVGGYFIGSSELLDYTQNDATWVQGQCLSILI